MVYVFLYQIILRNRGEVSNSRPFKSSGLIVKKPRLKMFSRI
jgi:hypothetical protein